MLGDMRGALVALPWWSASAQRSRLSPATFTVVAMTGPLLGLGMVRGLCPMAHVAPHALVFHVGATALAVTQHPSGACNAPLVV